MNFSHEVVICTKDRPLEIESILNCLSHVDRDENFIVIIIENSEDEINKIKTKEIASKYKHLLNLAIYDSLPGLPTSRNLALTKTSADLITFLDDDVLVEKDYFKKLDALATEESDAAGFGGIIVNSLDKNAESSFSLIKIFNMLLARMSLPAIYFFRSRWNNNIHKRKKVNWIPGCAMSFRTSHIRNLKFNEALENGPTKGYALGEDFDFTFKLSSRHPLIQDSSLKVHHLLSQTNRSKTLVMEEAIGRWIAYQDKVLFHPLMIPISFTILTVQSIFSAVFGIKSKHGSSYAFVRLRAYLDELFNPRLV